jgi:DNA-binding CsgD family transcriptional regulator/PAS domain-containing protein
MLPDSVRSAIENLYEAGFERSLWQAGLGRLCDSIGADSAITVPRVAAEDTIILPFSSDLAEFAERFVVDGWYRDDYRANRGWPLTDRGQTIVLEQDIATEEDHAREPIYQELMLPYGKKWWGGITFKSPSRQYVLSVFRGSRAEMFAEQDRPLFEAISGHLARIVTTAERVGWVQTSLGLGVLEAMDEAAILLDGQGRVLEMTGAAESLMGDSFTVIGRQVSSLHKGVARKIGVAVQKAIAEGPDGSPPLRIERQGKRPLLIDLLPVPNRFDGVFFFARFMLLITDLERQPLPSTTLLRQVFGLTSAEAQIAVGLTSGMSLSEAAENCGVTRETAKTHLKAIFFKTDTNRQSALVGLIRSIMARRG